MKGGDRGWPVHIYCQYIVFFYGQDNIKYPTKCIHKEMTFSLHCYYHLYVQLLCLNAKSWSVYKPLWWSITIEEMLVRRRHMTESHTQGQFHQCTAVTNCDSHSEGPVLEWMLCVCYLEILITSCLNLNFVSQVWWDKEAWTWAKEKCVIWLLVFPCFRVIL